MLAKCGTPASAMEPAFRVRALSKDEAVICTVPLSLLSTWAGRPACILCCHETAWTLNSDACHLTMWYLLVCSKPLLDQ